MLNTGNKRDAELYNQAIKPFDIKYDGGETTFYNFLNKIRQRAGHLMCESIYEMEEEGTTLNFFEDYTNISTTQTKNSGNDTLAKQQLGEASIVHHGHCHT